MIGEASFEFWSVIFHRAEMSKRENNGRDGDPGRICRSEEKRSSFVGERRKRRWRTRTRSFSAPCRCTRHLDRRWRRRSEATQRKSTEMVAHDDRRLLSPRGGKASPVRADNRGDRSLARSLARTRVNSGWRLTSRRSSGANTRGRGQVGQRAAREDQGEGAGEKGRSLLFYSRER